MWHLMFFWWLFPLFLLFAFAVGGRRSCRRDRADSGAEVSHLGRLLEEQGKYIEALEARLSRVEDGLEFTERMLSERATG